MKDDETLWNPSPVPCVNSNPSTWTKKKCNSRSIACLLPGLCLLLGFQSLNTKYAKYVNIWQVETSTVPRSFTSCILLFLQSRWNPWSWLRDEASLFSRVEYAPCAPSLSVQWQAASRDPRKTRIQTQYLQWSNIVQNCGPSHPHVEILETSFQFCCYTFRALGLLLRLRLLLRALPWAAWFCLDFHCPWCFSIEQKYISSSSLFLIQVNVPTWSPLFSANLFWLFQICSAAAEGEPWIKWQGPTASDENLEASHLMASNTMIFWSRKLTHTVAWRVSASLIFRLVIPWFLAAFSSRAFEDEAESREPTRCQRRSGHRHEFNVLQRI